MVQEVRKIILNEDELRAAFERHRVTPNFLPDGKIIGCKIAADDCVVVTLELPYGSRVQHSNFVFNAADVVNPLIRFCLENNIMLPKNGRKSFRVIDNQPCLQVELDLEIEIEHGDTNAVMTMAHMDSRKPTAEIVPLAARS